MSDGDNKSIKIGTRKSQLALVQTKQVKEILEEKYPGTKFEIVEMSTKGDNVQDRALFKIGDKSLFTKELEIALIKEDVDIVVHSLKDLPGTLPDGLVIGAVLEREDPSDVILLKENGQHKTWEELVQNSENLIGTSSVRRIAQLRAKYPKLKFEHIRGNLNTRLQKLDNPKSGEPVYDALILAAAGVIRLEWKSRIHRKLYSDECLHAVGQGALAVECKFENKKILQLLKTLNHKETAQAVIAERALMRELGGGCSVPLAGSAHVEDKNLHVEAGVWSLCGKQSIRCDLTVNLDEKMEEFSVKSPKGQISAIAIPFGEEEKEYIIAEQGGIKLAQEMKNKGAKEILDNARKQNETEGIPK